VPQTRGEDQGLAAPGFAGRPRQGRGAGGQGEGEKGARGAAVTSAGGFAPLSRSGDGVGAAGGTERDGADGIGEK